MNYFLTDFMSRPEFDNGGLRERPSLKMGVVGWEGGAGAGRAFRSVPH